MQILKDIEAIVGTKGILTGDDVSNRKAGIWIDEGIKAKAIVRPKNTEELSKVLKICNEKRATKKPKNSLSIILKRLTIDIIFYAVSVGLTITGVGLAFCLFGPDWKASN